MYEKSKIPFSYMQYAYSVKRAYRGTKPKESLRWRYSSLRMYIYLFGCHMGSLVIYQLTFLCMCPISQSLLLQDQLTKEILKGNVFCGSSEQPINFQPSYKFDINTNNYDTSEKQRIPSWTVSLHPFIHPPTHPSFHPPTHPPTYPFTTHAVICRIVSCLSQTETVRWLV